MQDYTDCDATELARRVRAGETSPAELVEAAIAALERVEPTLQGLVHRMDTEARAAARAPLGEGPFAGVPMVVKDFDGFVKGVPFTASTRLLEGFVPQHDAEAIARLRRAGLIFLGKSKLPELAIVGTTESAWRGVTHNPWSLEHTPGGSSGGSAALVAARAVPVAHGGDGGGSLRIPASSCGLVGLKCTRGRIPLGPDHGEGWGGYVQWGVLTRTVRDTAALVDVMAGPMPGEPYAAPPLPGPLRAELGQDPGRLRVALWPYTLYGRHTDPECVTAAVTAAKQLETLGHTVEEVRPPIDPERLRHAYLVQIAAGVGAELEEMARWAGRPLSADLVEPSTWFLRQVSQSLGALDLLHAREVAQEAGRRMGELHTRYDLFLGPTVAHPPVKLGTLTLKPAERAGLAALRALPLRPAIRQVLNQLAANNFEATPNTQLFNQTGQPAISLPLHWTAAGLPVGVQLAAALGREDLLIRVAAQLEQAMPWSGRRPGVCA